MADAKYEVSQTEANAPVRRDKKRGCVAHCKRFWWLHLLIFILIVVLVICLIIFVAVPKVAQSKMDAAELDIQGVNILRTTPDSYLMEINSTITTDGSIHADIDPFEGSMYLADVENAPAFATLQFPKTNADKFQRVNISQTIQIKDLNAFKQFNVKFYQSEKVRVRIEGKTQAQPAGLSRKYDVTFSKVLDVAGLKLFAGAKVDGNVDIAASKGTPNFKGFADIPNPSHFTLDIGNASFTNFADEQNLGSLTINNLVVHPGINTVPIEAELDQLKILGIITKKPYCESGIVPFKLLGTGVVKNGQKLEYFADALASANQTVNIDIGAILKKAVSGFELSCSGSSSTS